MNETLINFETAKLAKEKGFTEKRSSAYVYRNELHQSSNYKGILIHSNILCCDIPAPTQSLLQKWLREKYKIDIYIFPCYSESVYSNDRELLGYFPCIQSKSIDKCDCKTVDTYEEALEDGLQQALKLI